MITFADCLSASSQIGERNDCTVKAIAIAGQFEYQKVHSALAARGRRKGNGTVPLVWERAMRDLGLTWTETTPRKPDGGQYTMKTIGRVFPKGRHIVQVNGHVAALVDGEVEDWTKGRQHRVTRVLTVTPGAAHPYTPVVHPVRAKLKNLNPQPVINYKKSVVEHAGGSLTFLYRRWILMDCYGTVIRRMTSTEFSQVEASTLAEALIK